MLAVVAPAAAETPPLSPARAVLAAAIAAHTAALAAAEAAAAPARRLQAVRAAYAEAGRQLAEARADDEATLGDWLAAGAEGERPSPSIPTRSAERRLDELAADAAAAARALPAVEARHADAVRLLTAAGQARSTAIAGAAVEAAREVIAGEMAPALDRLLMVEARLSGLAAELRRLGHAPHNSAAALSASLDIDGRLRAAKAEAGVPRADAIGHAFLDALALDPQATL